MVDAVYGEPSASTPASTDVIVRQGSFRRISWGGIFAGLFLVLSVQLLLSMLGLGIGLGMVQPGQGGVPNADTVGIGAAIWWVVTYLIALVIGSHAAARLAGVGLRFDGVLHGLVTWAFALMVTFYLLTTAVGGVLGGAFGVVGNALSVAGQGFKAAAPEVAKAAGIAADQAQQRAKELLQPTDPSKMSNEQAETQLSKDVGSYLAGGGGAPQARDQIMGIMAAKLGISRDDAAKRFDQWAGQFNQAKSTAAQSAKQAADRAAGVLSQASIWAFVALLLGRFLAALVGPGALGREPWMRMPGRSGRIRPGAELCRGPAECCTNRAFQYCRYAVSDWSALVIRQTLLWTAAAGMLGIAGCATPQQQVGQKEDLLAAAGFQVRPADSPHRIAAMRTLPANRFVTRVRNGELVYLYADPLDCNCLYLGNQQNWDAYKQEVFARQIANQNEMTAIMNQESWDWGPWGFP